MNAIASRLQAPKLSVALLVVLLVFAPYAMSLGPYEVLYTTGVWSAKHSADPLFPQRFTLVLLGLTSAIVAFGQFIWSFRPAPPDLTRIGCSAAVCLACAVVGWRSYPYWATGVYQVDIGTFPPVDQDPKSLIPMVWIGELWRLPVLLLNLVCLIAIPLLVGVAVISFSKRRFLPGLFIIFCAGVAVLFMLEMVSQGC